jgi:hypothetical protein
MQLFCCNCYLDFEAMASSKVCFNCLRMNSDSLIYVSRYFSLLLRLSALQFVLYYCFFPFFSYLMILFKIEELMIFFTFHLRQIASFELWILGFANQRLNLTETGISNLFCLFEWEKYCRLLFVFNFCENLCFLLSSLFFY